VPVSVGCALIFLVVGSWWCKRRQKRAEQQEEKIAVEAVEVAEAAHAVIQQEGGFHVMIAVQPSIEGVQGEIDGI
jgi:hypothetical protein